MTTRGLPMCEGWIQVEPWGSRQVDYVQQSLVKERQQLGRRQFAILVQQGI